jgi:hypothetical protein
MKRIAAIAAVLVGLCIPSAASATQTKNCRGISTSASLPYDGPCRLGLSDPALWALAHNWSVNDLNLIPMQAQNIPQSDVIGISQTIEGIGVMSQAQGEQEPPKLVIEGKKNPIKKAAITCLWYGALAFTLNTGLNYLFQNPFGFKTGGEEALGACITSVAGAWGTKKLNKAFKVSA